MKVPRAPHRWNLSPTQAVSVQQRLRSQVRLQTAAVPGQIAGLDCAIMDESIIAVAVVWDVSRRTVLETRAARAPLTFPYVPGLLSFRELPVLLTALRRTRIGPFDAADGLPIGPGEEPPGEEALRSRIVAPLDLVRAAGVPEVRLDADRARCFLIGNALEADGPDATPVAAVHADDDLLLGLGERERGHLHPRKVFASAQAALLPTPPP